MVSHSRVRRVHPLLSLAGLAATPGMVPLTGNPPWRGWPHDKARAASPYHTPWGPAGFIDVSWNAELYLDRDATCASHPANDLRTILKPGGSLRKYDACR